MNPLHFFRTLPTRSVGSLGSVLARGAAGSMAVKVAGAAMALLSQLILVRVMPADEYGQYAYLISLLTTAAMFTRVGADMAFLRYLPTYLAAERWGAFKGILGWGSRVSFFASCSVALAGVLSAYLNMGVSELFWSYAAAWCSLPLLSLSFLRQGALRSLRKVVLAELPESVIRFGLVALFVVALNLALDRPVNSLEAMLASLLVYLICYGIGAVWQRRHTPAGVFDAPREEFRGEWFRTSVPLLVSTSMAMLVNQAGIIALGMSGDAVGAGVFSIVIRISMLLGFGLMAINSISAPMISELHAAGKRQELQRLITLSSRASAIFSFVCGIFVLIFGDLLLSWFGSASQAGYSALCILVIGQIATSSMGSVTYLVSMTGHHLAGSFLSAVVGLGCVAFNAMLVPRFGVSGAAAATALSLTLSSLSLAIYMKRRTGIRSFAILA